MKLLEGKGFFSFRLTKSYRSQYGSVSPAAIVVPEIAAAFVSAAVAFCKVMDRRKRRV